MASLKRSTETDSLASNISSKVYVRSTRSGKVQKIVREVYLRTDIPCSSKLCKACLQDAPRNAAQQGEMPHRIPVLQLVNTHDSSAFRPFGQACWHQDLLPG